MAASPGGVEVGRISVRVVPDTSRLGSDLKVALDRVEAQTDLKISTSIDTTKLDEQARLAVDQAQAAAGDINIKTNVDTSQLREATAASQGLSSGLSGIVSAAIVLGPALVPLVAVLGGLAAALAAPAALAGGGLTIFGFITGAAIKQTEAQNKKLIQLKAAVDAAKQSLANTTASAATSASNSLTTAQASAAASLKSAQQALANAHTVSAVSAAAARVQAAHASLSARTSAIQASQSASVAAAQRKVNEATLAYQAALKGMTPAQLKFIKAQDSLKSAFHNLLAAVGSSVLGPVTKTLQILASIMPKIQPILIQFASVFDAFLSSASDATKGRGFSNLVHLIATQGVLAFKTFAHIIGNVILGISRLGLDLLPFGQSVLTGLGNAAKGFADFAKSAKAKGQVKSFLDYIRTVGPKVGQTLGDIAGAFGNIVKAVAPIGTVVLDAVDGLAKAIEKVPTKTLTAIAAAVAGIVVALKFLAPLKGAFKFIVDNPYVAVMVGLAAGFVLLYQHSKPLRQVLGDLKDFFTTQLLPIIKNAAEKVVPALNSAFHDISKTIRQNKGFLEVVGKLLAVMGSATVVLGLYAVVAAIRAIGLAFKFGVPLVRLLADAFLIFIEKNLRAFAILTTGIEQSLGGIVHSAAIAFGWLPGIGPKVKAADQAFHDFTSKVVANLIGAADQVKAFRTQLDEVLALHPKIKINIDDLVAVKKLEELQAFRFQDKTLTITTNFVERVVGPSGGIGQPSKNNANGIPAPIAPPLVHTGGPHPGSGGGSSRGGDTYNIEAHDYHDFLRQLATRKRGQSGGGVLFPSAGGVR